jgi:hypothetical protein
VDEAVDKDIHRRVTVCGLSVDKYRGVYVSFQYIDLYNFYCIIHSNSVLH